MNTEIGGTLVNGYSLSISISSIYKDLRDRIETNSVSSKYVFTDISDVTPTFNVIKRYPLSLFKTFSNVAEVNIKNIAVIPATVYDLKCSGFVMLIDASTTILKAIGMIKSVSLTDVEMLWLEYISEAKQVLSSDENNLISIGSDGKLFLNKNKIELKDNKINQVNADIDIVKVFETYLDYNPRDIKKLENIHDGAHVVILKDQLHDNKAWLYVLSSTDAISPVITSVGEYVDIDKYPSVVALKEYVDASIMKSNRKLDGDTIVHNKSTNLWGVAIDRHTINKNKNGLYSVDLDVLREEMLKVESIQDNVPVFNDNGYIKDAGWGITIDSESIDGEEKKLVSKKFLQMQKITDSETSDLIGSVEINKK